MKFLAVVLLSFLSFGKDVSVTTKEWPTVPLQGTPVLLGDAQTKLIILDFWASWCGPCRESLPAYSELQKKYSDRGVRFYGISADESVDEAKKFLKEVSFSFPAAWDKDRTLANFLKLEAIPSLVFLSKDGKILDQETGFTEKVKKGLPARIEKLLKTQL